MMVALVTGAAKGLGFAWCRQLARLGYTVVLTARKQEQAEDAAKQLQEEGLMVIPKSLEVCSEQALAELAGWLGETYGKLDLLVNNAGINPKDYDDKSRMARAFYLDALDAAEMLHVLHVNSIAPLLVVKHFRALLAKSDRALVINISSWLGSVTNLGFGGHYGYVGSKNLLNVLNKSMANELKPDRIICINVNPGWVATDMGGPRAQFTADEAVQNILTQVVSGISMKDTGKFLNYDGTEHPW